MKNISRVLTALGLSFVFTLALSQPVWAENNNADLPTEKTLKSELAEAQKLPDGDEKTNNVTTIQASLDFLQQIQTQQKNNNDLQDTLIDADSEIQKNSADLQNLKKQLSTPSNTDYASQSLANLQAQVEKLTNQQQDAQSALSAET
jgi:potassium-dependent mechanosensitive channel